MRMYIIFRMEGIILVRLMAYNLLVVLLTNAKAYIAYIAYTIFARQGFLFRTFTVYIATQPSTSSWIYG